MPQAWDIEVTLTEKTPNKGLWNKEQSPLFDPQLKKWQIRDVSEVPYSDQNLKKISIETDWNSKVATQRNFSSPKNQHCRPL